MTELDSPENPSSRPNFAVKRTFIIFKGAKGARDSLVEDTFSKSMCTLTSI